MRLAASIAWPFIPRTASLVLSTLGEHADPAYRLNVPEEHKAVFYGVNHMEVQYHPAVRNQVINWLVPEAFVPRNVVTNPEAGRRIEYVDL